MNDVINNPPIQLSSFWDKYKVPLLTGALGAGVGSLALGGSTSVEDGSTPEQQAEKRRNNYLMGAALGGLAGAGGGAMYNYALAPDAPPGPMSTIINKSLKAKTLYGGLGAQAGHAVLRKGVKPTGSMEELRKSITEALDPKKEVNTDVTGPSIGTKLDTGKVENIRRQVQGLAARRNPLSALSQTRVGRGLGFNMTPNEHELATALAQLNRNPGALNQILDGAGGGALPFIKNELANPGSLHRANIRSGVARTAGGMIAAPTAAAIANWLSEKLKNKPSL